MRDITRPTGVAALAGTAGTVASARRVLGAEDAVDAAEINTRAYGGLNANAARDLRDKWAAPLAETLGVETAKLLTAWTDATKLGIPAAGASAFAELTAKTSAAWEVDVSTVSDILGTVNSLLTSKGEAFDAGKLKSVANTLQHLAAKQSTTPEKLMSFLQRGAGAAQVLGMSQEAGLAFGSASTSLGNQAGQSGRMFDYLASRVIELPRLTKQHGDQGKQARDLVAALGYGSADAMDRKRRADPDSFLSDFMERFNRIKNSKKQDSAIRFFTGREWLGEFGRMVKGIDTYKEAVKLAKEAKGLDAIGAVWELHRTKLGFVFKQFRAGWLNILGEFGKELSPMARQAGDAFLAWSAKLRSGGLAARFRASIAGFIEGLGFRDLPALLEGVLGKPAEGGAGAIETWRSTFREFGAGIREVATGVKTFVGAFTGGSPETIARWAGRILTLSAALVILSPVLGIIGGLVSGILALGSAAATVFGAMKLAGLAGGTGAAGAIGAGVLATAGGIIGAAFLASIANKLGILKAPDVSKGWGRGLVDFLDPGLASRLYGDDPAPSAKVEKQSANSTWRDFIRPASFDSAGDLSQSVDRLGRTMSTMGAQIRLASFQSVGARAMSSFSAAGRSGGDGGGGFAPGAPGDPAKAFGRNFYTPPGMSVPGWYGKGSGGSASSNPANSAASAAMLDAIAGTESGKAGYDAVLGNGRYGTPSKPVSSMTLDEAFAFGRQVRARHGSSSALGRYQIVGRTMQAAQRALGVSGDAKFDPAMQDRMARWIARNQGLGAWEGLKGNPRAMAAAREAMARGGAQDAPNGAQGTEAAIPGLGGKGQFDGLRVKGSQATAGGGVALGITDLARQVQANLPGGVKHFAAFNDRYHAGTNSKHASGLAFDTSLIDGSKSREAAEAMRAKLRAAGLDASQFRVIDEYLNPSSRSTGGHIHTQFNSKDAADRYHAYVDSMRKAAGQGAPSSGELANGTGAPSANGLADQVPARPQSGAGGRGGPPSIEQGGTGFRPGGGSGGGTGSPVNITIHAGNQNPAELAGHVQRHVTEAWNYRSHDMEAELT